MYVQQMQCVVTQQDFFPRFAIKHYKDTVITHNEETFLSRRLFLDCWEAIVIFLHLSVLSLASHLWFLGGFFFGGGAMVGWE